MDNQQKNSLKKFYSDKFDAEQTSNLSLFLYTHSLAIMAKNQNGAVIGSHLHSFNSSLELKEIIETDVLINSDNTAGKLHVHNNHFCLVPSVLFDPSVKSTFLNFSTPVNEEKQEVFYEGVDSNNVQVVGAIEKDVLAFFDNSLPDMEITHGASLVLSYLFKDKNDMLGQELFIVAEEGHMYVAGFASSELKVFNRFPVKGDRDFLKYTFTVIHQLAFDRMHCRITQVGDLAGIQVDINILNQYFKNLVHADPRFNQTYSPGAEKFMQTKLLEAFWAA